MKYGEENHNRNKQIRRDMLRIKNRYGTTGQFIKNNIDYNVTVQSINLWLRDKLDLADVILNSLEKFVNDRI